MRPRVALSSWAPVLAWAGLIYFLSSLPSLRSEFVYWDFVLRKSAHVFEYAVLTLLLLRASRRTWNAWPWRRLAVLSVAVALLYAASDEFHQSFVPGRGPSVTDVLIDGVGVALAVGLAKRIKIYE